MKGPTRPVPLQGGLCRGPPRRGPSTLSDCSSTIRKSFDVIWTLLTGRGPCWHARLHIRRSLEWADPTPTCQSRADGDRRSRRPRSTSAGCDLLRALLRPGQDPFSSAAVHATHLFSFHAFREVKDQPSEPVQHPQPSSTPARFVGGRPHLYPPATSSSWPALRRFRALWGRWHPNRSATSSRSRCRAGRRRHIVPAAPLVVD